MRHLDSSDTGSLLWSGIFYGSLPQFEFNTKNFPQEYSIFDTFHANRFPGWSRNEDAFKADD